MWQFSFAVICLLPLLVLAWLACTCGCVLKHMKQGENGEPNEVEIEAHIFTCKICCNGCNKQFKGAKEVNKKEFGESLADVGMLAGKVGGRPRGRRQPQTCLQ
jgi:hypothetical protein